MSGGLSASKYRLRHPKKKYVGRKKVSSHKRKVGGKTVRVKAHKRAVKITRKGNTTTVEGNHYKVHVYHGPFAGHAIIPSFHRKTKNKRWGAKVKFRKGSVFSEKEALRRATSLAKSKPLD